MSAYGMTVTLLATQLCEAIAKDEAPEAGGFDLSAGLFGKAISDWIRETAIELDSRAIEIASLKSAARQESPADKGFELLRPALVGLVGADGREELQTMEATMRLLPAPAEDKAVSINAIHALLATLPGNKP